MKMKLFKLNFFPSCVFRAGLFLISYFILCVIEGSAQNVGIGITNPVRAKLEVFVVAGAGATSAIFGTDGTGISLQRNWPTISFNQYRDIVMPGSQGKYMANGFELWRGNIKISEVSHRLKATDTITLLWNGSYWIELSVAHNYY